MVERHYQGVWKPRRIWAKQGEKLHRMSFRRIGDFAEDEEDTEASTFCILENVLS